MRRIFAILLTSLLSAPLSNFAATDPILSELIAKNQQAAETAQCLDASKRDLLSQWTESYRRALQSQRCPVAASDSDPFPTPGVFADDETLRQAGKFAKEVMNLEHCLNAAQRIQYYDWRREQASLPASDQGCVQAKKPVLPQAPQPATAPKTPELVQVVPASPLAPQKPVAPVDLKNSIHARKRSGANPKVGSIDLPTGFIIDFELALESRSKMMQGRNPMVGTPLNLVGETVFDSLRNNPTISAYRLPYEWDFTLVDSNVINASSTAGGKIYVDAGLARLIGTNRGLWSAVLSHEVAHTALRHQVISYLQAQYIAQQIQYFSYLVAAGDKSAVWALAGFQIAAPIAFRKIQREQEHAADSQGMLLMARVGYHPDNVFALHHLLRDAVGDQSKFGAFFSDHPRWETRDQRSEKAYVEALAEYNRLWPNASESPGGTPPVVAFIGEPHATENKQDRTADIVIPLYCRNATKPLTLMIQFSHDKVPVSGHDGRFLSSSGNLEVRESINCFEKEDSSPFEIRLPATALLEKDRKVRAEAIVIDPEEDVPIEHSKPFDVRFPKPQ